MSQGDTYRWHTFKCRFVDWNENSMLKIQINQEIMCWSLTSHLFDSDKPYIYMHSEILNKV